MANGSFSNGSGANCKLVINWSSSKGNSGSTVSATLVAQNQNNWYFNAYVYGGYGITINGSQVTGSNNALSGSINGSASLISHSVWVSYTGDKTINISGYANFNGIPSLTNQTIGGNVKLDNVGYVPTMGDVTAPVASVISETSTSIKITWNKATSYNGSCTYGVGCSINGGDYDWKYPKDSNINTTTYTWELSSPSQGTTYKFVVAAKNNIGWSEYKYSGIVTINQISPPTIGDIPVYNPYVNSEVAINLTGGSQTNNGDFKRLCDLYFGDTKIASCKGYNNTSWNNTTQSIAYAAADYVARIGTKAYSSDNFKIVAWCENANHTKSTTTSKTFTVNINTDGKAVPSMGACTLSGGAFSYPSTCFISGVSNLNVTAATATANRAPSGTTMSYSISVTGVPSQNSKSANFGSLTAGQKTITVTATDSRGLSTTASRDIQFQSYSMPSIRNYSAVRLDNPQTSVKLTYTLAYSPIYAYDKGVNTKGAQLNNINVQQYSTNNSSWSTASNGCTITGLSTETVYTIYLRVTDKVKTSEYKTETYKVPTIRTNVAIRRHGVGINCVPQSSYALEVSGSGRIASSLNVGGNTTVGGTLDATNMLHVNSKGVAIGKSVEKDGLEVKGDVYCTNFYPSGKISKQASGCSWVHGRDSTLLYSRYSSSVGTGSLNSAVTMGTPTTAWTLGTVNDDCYLTCISDTDYNNGTNRSIGQYRFPSTGTWETILLKAFPVGAVYITYNNNNPSNFLGGTWEQFGQGRTLIGQGTGSDGSTSMSFTDAGDTGGSYKSSHHHLTPFGWDMNAFFAGRADGAANGNYDRTTVVPNGYKINISSSATSQVRLNWSDERTINVTQPYITVYFWRRTA